MAKEYRIHIRGKQREIIDADLMARLVVMLGRQLAQDAKEAADAARNAQDAEGLVQDDEDRTSGPRAGGLA
jgi:hypothetical protein